MASDNHGARIPLRDSQKAYAGRETGKQRERAHAWFDPYLRPESASLASFIRTDVLPVILSGRSLQRQPKGERLEALTATIEASICNLLHALPQARDGDARPLRIGVLLGRPKDAKASRYEHPQVTARWKAKALEGLDAQGMLMLEKGTTGTATIFTPTSAFIRDMTRRGFTPHDTIRADDAEECLQVSRSWREWEEEDDGGGAMRLRRELVDYADTPEADALRRDTLFLRSYVAVVPVTLTEVDSERPPLVDIQQRHLRRIFHATPDAPVSSPGVWRSGGRFYGGFWQTLKKSYRRDALRIAEERTLEVDFTALHPRLALIHCGAEPHDIQSNPYGEIGGWPEEHRPGLKTLYAALFNHDRPLTRLPSKMARDARKDSRMGLPLGWSLRDAVGAILKRYPMMADAFGSRFGFRAMWIESEILLRTFKALELAGIQALPNHDGVLARANQAEKVRDVMQDAALQLTSHRLPVEIKGGE